jgi:hypothetical protein
MKAERRHELQENTLAHVLSNFPLYLSIYAGRILTVLLIVVLGFLLLRYRAQSKQQQFETTRINLASAREATYQLNGLVGGFRAPAEMAQLRGSLLKEANAALDATLANADTETIKAEATVARGDLYWTAANLPDLPGAATQPALALPQPREELLSAAESAYQQVVSGFPNEQLARATALMGLGAIAENRRKFDEAEAYYKQLKDGPNTPDLFKALAESRIQQIPLISKERRLVTATQPSTQPATLPSSIAVPQPVEIEATTQPATNPG